MGCTSANSKDLAYYLIDQQSKFKGISFAEASAAFWHKLSFLIHRHVSICILRRIRKMTYKHDDDETDIENIAPDPETAKSNKRPRVINKNIPSITV